MTVPASTDYPAGNVVPLDSTTRYPGPRHGAAFLPFVQSMSGFVYKRSGPQRKFGTRLAHLPAPALASHPGTQRRRRGARRRSCANIEALISGTVDGSWPELLCDSLGFLAALWAIGCALSCLPCCIAVGVLAAVERFVDTIGFCE